MTTKVLKILALIAATTVGALSVPAPQYRPREIKYSASDGSFHAVANGADQRVGGAQSGNAARKVDAANSIEYAASGGSDSNNGKSWDTAKATVMAAYDALPAQGGAIYICSIYTHAINWTSTGQGAWIMGPKDPNYASPPTGWRKLKSAAFIGACPDTAGFQQPVNYVNMNHALGPDIWISSTTGQIANITFKNLLLQYAVTSNVVLGVDSNGAQTNNSGVWNVSFFNITTNVGQTAGTGPGWLIGGGDTFGILLDGVSASGNSTATPGSDAQAAILFKPTGGSGRTANGMIKNSFLSGGGIKYYEGTNGGTMSVKDTYSEAINGTGVTPGVGTFWAASTNQASITRYNLDHVYTADPVGPVCDVRIDVFAWHQGDISVTGGSLICSPHAIQQGSIVGANLGPRTGYVDPLTQGISGVSYGRYYGFLGNTQRQLAPSMVRYQNLAPSTSSSWTISGTGGSIATGIAAPDGTTGAARVRATTNTVTATFYSQSLSLAVGQYFVAGLYMRFNSPDDSYEFSGAVGAVPGVKIGVGGTRNTVSCSLLWPPGMKTDGWFWSYQICRVTAAPTSPATVTVIATAPVVRAHASVMDFYAPMLLNIPAGSISNDEVYELANNLVPYANTCMVGTLCGILGSSGGVGPPRISSGFGTGASVTANNGTSAFRINVGSSNTGNGVIGLPAASRGWNCFANDISTTSAAVSQTKQTASTKTTATLQNYTDTSGTGAWVDGDVLAVSCFAY